jgi:hypothetical protein
VRSLLARGVLNRRAMTPTFEPIVLKKADRVAGHSMRAEAVRISPLLDVTEADSDIITMLVEGSFDAAVRTKNYLPACMNEAQALDYCRTTDGVVLWLGDRPVGVAALLPNPNAGEGVEIPAGVCELDMWVLPQFRGIGMRWFPLMKVWAAQHHDQLLGVTWADNTTAIALLRWSGWKWLGRSFWQSGSCSGHCEVFLYDLTPHRDTTEPRTAPRHAAS